jgi:hypothetical protein
MKTKLQMPVAILALIFFAASVSGQGVNPSTGIPGQPAFNPTTGQPLSPTAGQPAVPAFDPATGAPLAPAAEQPNWKDSDWKDPDIVLADVNFDGIPMSEIASFIRERFKGEFDIILPAPSGGQGAFNSITGMPVPLTDWNSEILQLHLKNVTASELFNAMNLVFENDKMPLRWELKINGHRQIALLRVLVQPYPSAFPAPPPEAPVRRIYFVGDLIGDEKNGGMSMEQIIKTITDVWQMADTANGNIQFHKEAQLLILSGTPSQVEFMEQTLKALRQKVDLARHSRSTAAKSKPDESNK